MSSADALRALRALRVAARGFAHAETEAAKADGDVHADPTEALLALSSAAIAYTSALRAEVNR